jgi:hypothetical protein
LLLGSSQKIVLQPVEDYDLAMLNRRVAATLAAFALALPLAAFERGDVLLENRTHAQTSASSESSFDIWMYSGGAFALPLATVLSEKQIPYMGAGRFLVPSGNKIVFHHDQTVSAWDGVARRFTEEGKGYSDIFQADTELGEIAPMRSGNFLVAERWNTAARGAKLIEFNLKGRVTDHAFPVLTDPATNRVVGASHIELLADQCTVLYTVGNDHPLNNVVRRLNICTNQAQTDFASLPAGQYAGSIRQLPDGSVLVANGSAVLQFTGQGSLLLSYPFQGVTHLALNPDAKSFWAAGVDLDQANLRRFDVGIPDSGSARLPLGNEGAQSFVIPLDVSDLVVVSEWRAATNKEMRPRFRPVRH